MSRRQWGGRKRTASHKSPVHAPGVKTSDCFCEQHSLSSLPPPFLHPQELWLFLSQVHWAAALCSLLLAGSSALRLPAASSYHVSGVNLVVPFRSPGGGHQPTWAICLDVMEVWGCGGRLGSSQPSGEAQSRRCQKNKEHTPLCVCVSGLALSYCVSPGLTQK